MYLCTCVLNIYSKVIIDVYILINAKEIKPTHLVFLSHLKRNVLFLIVKMPRKCKNNKMCPIISEKELSNFPFCHHLYELKNKLEYY